MEIQRRLGKTVRKLPAFIRRDRQGNPSLDWDLVREFREAETLRAAGKTYRQTSDLMEEITARRSGRAMLPAHPVSFRPWSRRQVQAGKWTPEQVERLRKDIRKRHRGKIPKRVSRNWSEVRIETRLRRWKAPLDAAVRALDTTCHGSGGTGS